MSTLLTERLPTGFTLTDGLDPSLAEQLANGSQKLERTLPLEDPNPTPAARERAARARDERRKQLADALESTLPLLASSHYDIQVLAVLLRLLVEAEGLDGSHEALLVVGRMLHEGWSGLTAALAGRAPRDQERQRRKWARYVDAVFEQLHSWLARERERDERTLADRVAGAAAGWIAALEQVERGLRAVAAAVARFDAIDRALRELCRERGAPALPALEPPSAGAGPDARTSTVVPPSSETANAAGTPGAAARAEAIRAGAAPAVASAGSDPGVAASAGSDPGVAAPTPSALLRVSGRFWELQRRVAAFDALLERGEYEKAGIVESDLRESLEHFDVAGYFPGLFARYFERCAEHATRLAAPHPESGGLRSSALARLYRTDLERFLELREPSLAREREAR